MSAVEAASRGYKHRTKRVGAIARSAAGGDFGHPPFPDAPFRWRGATKVFDAKSRREATQMRRFCGIILAVALSIACIAAGLADPAPPAGVPTEDGMRAFALQWFAQMQAGKIAPTQNNPPHSAPFTHDAGQAMSHHLNHY